MASTSNRFVTSGALALLAGLLYLNALHNPFIYDDYHTVVTNQSLTQPIDLRAIVLHDMTRPITNFSYAVDHALWGPTPFGYHLTNVLLHMLNVVLLFSLAWLLTGSLAITSATTVLLAVHPMMTEAVGYISGRSELLSATFLLSGLICGRNWIQGRGAKWGVATLAAWIAMLGTKELGAMFPFILCGYDFLLVRSEKKRRVTTIYLPIVGIAVLAGVARVVVLAREYPGQVTIHWSYLLIALDVIRRYLSLLIFPSGQTIFHSVANVTSIVSVRALVAFIVVGGLIAGAWGARRRAPLVAFGLLTFFLLLVPSTVLILLDQGEPMAEHRIYTASVGFFLAVGGFIGLLDSALPGRDRRLRWYASAAMVIVAVTLAAQTVLRNQVWADPVALWRESVDLAPAHYRPRLLLGEALQDQARREEAVEQYRTAISLRPSDPTGHVKLGGCLAEMGDLEAAKQHFLEALRIDPANPSARQALSILNEMESRPRNGAGDSGRR